jgi:glutathione S-transferase
LGFGEPDRQVVESSWETLKDILERMNSIMTDRPYLAGAEFSLVDIWTMPWFASVDRVRGEAEVLRSFPCLRDWWLRVSRRPAWLKTAEMMQEAFHLVEAPK